MLKLSKLNYVWMILYGLVLIILYIIVLADADAQNQPTPYISSPDENLHESKQELILIEVYNYDPHTGDNYKKIPVVFVDRTTSGKSDTFLVSVSLFNADRSLVLNKTFIPIRNTDSTEFYH